MQHGGLIYDIVSAGGFLKKIDYVAGLFLSILLVFRLVSFTVGCTLENSRKQISPEK